MLPSRLVLYRIAFLLGADAAFLALIALLLPEEGSLWQEISSAAVNMAPSVLAGLGMTGIILAGSIDLSIGAAIAVAGSVFGILVHHGAPPPACYAACFAAAWLISMANGGLVRLLGIPGIIVTLAGLSVYRGVALMAADVAIPAFSGNISVIDDAYHGPGKHHAGSILVAAVACALLWEAFARTPRLWRARGSSEEACRIQGLSPGGILQSAFFAGGLFLGLAALLQVTQIQAIEPARLALGFELPVIGAVVLGGTHIFGGEGSYLGTVAGAFFLHFAQQLLVYAGVSEYWREVIIGAAILGVIGMDCRLHRRRKLLEELT
ncbi:MAG: ABC transporter permease [Planctomycetes bacterium]|nr:ABC transporter permease [Planctomycetota bacterium]